MVGAEVKVEGKGKGKAKAKRNQSQGAWLEWGVHEMGAASLHFTLFCGDGRDCVVDLHRPVKRAVLKFACGGGA